MDCCFLCHRTAGVFSARTAGVFSGGPHSEKVVHGGRTLWLPLILEIVKGNILCSTNDVVVLAMLLYY